MVGIGEHSQATGAVLDSVAVAKAVAESSSVDAAAAVESVAVLSVSGRSCELLLVLPAGEVVIAETTRCQSLVSDGEG